LYSALHGIQTTLKRSGMDHTDLPAVMRIGKVRYIKIKIKVKIRNK